MQARSGRSSPAEMIRTLIRAGAATTARKSSSRSAGATCFESFSAASGRTRWLRRQSKSRRTPATTSGPASEPRPASSAPGHEARAEPAIEGEEALARSSGVSFPGWSRTDGSLAGTCSDMPTSRRALVAVLLLAFAACHPDFKVGSFPPTRRSIAPATEEFSRGRWDNAVAAFEKLTTDLPARDTLLPRAYWYLASAHEQQRE